MSEHVEQLRSEVADLHDEVAELRLEARQATGNCSGRSSVGFRTRPVAAEPTPMR